MCADAVDLRRSVVAMPNLVLLIRANLPQRRHPRSNCVSGFPRRLLCIFCESLWCAFRFGTLQPQCTILSAQSHAGLHQIAKTRRIAWVSSKSCNPAIRRVWPRDYRMFVVKAPVLPGCKPAILQSGATHDCQCGRVLGHCSTNVHNLRAWRDSFSPLLRASRESRPGRGQVWLRRRRAR